VSRVRSCPMRRPKASRWVRAATRRRAALARAARRPPRVPSRRARHHGKEREYRNSCLVRRWQELPEAVLLSRPHPMSHHRGKRQRVDSASSTSMSGCVRHLRPLTSTNIRNELQRRLSPSRKAWFLVSRTVLDRAGRQPCRRISPPLDRRDQREQ